ncbi:hemolysin family protein [Aquisalibacillus elongatus]|uniref:Mg2+/Co2+ transporter CorB n=1 Tax=Aquisalibacillus elongatus TaxID=485577 RepID=A0A3N5C2F7_9BACI|nr:CNNM domain-containing protein [Aquisalibacillus elongatus]RPF52195.1 Mg2+/Co2+ transporter CorB [Aquisalibacillus elongatus]
MIFAIIALIFVSFFFSGSETALTATNHMKLQSKAKNGDKKSEKLLNLVQKPNEFITSILIGNNISNIVLPTLVTTMAIQYGFDVATATAILTITIIIVAEVIPKSVAAAFPDRISYIVYPVIRAVVTIFKPITIVLNWMTDSITRRLSKGEKTQYSFSKEEFKAMIDIADSEGTFHDEESFRIKGVLDFQNLNVKDVLQTPRIEIVSLDAESTFEEVRDVIIQNPYTRYPITDGDIDHIIGVFHSKFFIQWSTQPEKSLQSTSDMDPLIVYEFQSIEHVFREMTKHNKHIAIVLDEYGGTEGIVTHEDIIEAMIGLEIEDEIDAENDSMIEKITDTEIICDGKIPLRRLNAVFNTEIPEEEDVLSGFLLKEINDFPDENDVIERHNLSFKILEIDERSIKKVQIVK